MKPTLDRPLLLRGNVVSSDGSVDDRYVLVENSMIRSVTRQRPLLTGSSDPLVIELTSNDWIFPGCLDLHSHTDKNVMPIWEHNKGYFNNRFEWRKDPDYKREIGGVSKAVKKSFPKGVAAANAVFAELQAVAGGTTALQEDWDLDDNILRGGNPLLCRGTGDAADFGLDPKMVISSVTDFFKANDKMTRPEEVFIYDREQEKYTDVTKLEEYVEQRKNGTLQATLVHLAEGRSDFGDFRGGSDPYSRLEWETFMKHPAMKDAERVSSSALSLIHGCGIDVHDPKHIRFLRDRNINIIWSPVSNFLLYGNTLEVEPLIEAGINVALGSDWSPSGSKHVWDEAKHARFFLDAIGSSISDVQVMRMVTTNAARCLGLTNAGRIAEGCVADFFILRNPLESDDPVEAFFKTTDRNVRAVVVGGVPIYGDRNFLEPFDLPLQKLPQAEGGSVRNKAVHLPPRARVDIEKDILRLEKEFKKQGVYRSNLLVSSDAIYQKRVNRLRERMIRFGWRASRVRRRKAKSLPRFRVKAPPDAVRVWRGFRKDGLSPEDFLDKLSRIFIPGTPAFQAPLGLTAYLPALLPTESRTGIPDEVALIFYESQEVYTAATDTIAGRAYGALHGDVFEFSDESRRSTSTWPIPLKRSKIKAGQPYHLFDDAIDWQIGFATVFAAARKPETGAAEFLSRLNDWLRSVKKAPPPGLDGAIAVATEDYLVYWEHWESERESKKSPVTAIARDLEVILSTPASPLVVTTDMHLRNEGVGTLAGDEAFNLRFDRRHDLDI